MMLGMDRVEWLITGGILLALGAGYLLHFLLAGTILGHFLAIIGLALAGAVAFIGLTAIGTGYR